MSQVQPDAPGCESCGAGVAVGGQESAPQPGGPGRVPAAHEIAAGVQAASTATAHKLARIVYLALKHLDMLVIRKNAHRFSVALVGVETWSNLSNEAQSPNTLRIHRPFQF
jgi:hypothetical protein